MKNKSLKQIFLAHQGNSTDKYDLYLRVYDKCLEHLRAEKIKMLEIGIQNGGSLEVWAKFFPKALSIKGCDINPDCAKIKFTDRRISIHIGDVNSKASLRKLASVRKQYHVIIEDGSHTSEDIIRTFVNYFDTLMDDGIFIFEDLHCSYWASYDGGINNPMSSIAFFKRLIDVLNFTYWQSDKAPTKAYFTDFEQHYGFTLPQAILQQIHSIEFFDSLCIISKKPKSLNTLGNRLVSGKIQSVVKNSNQWQPFASEPEGLLQTRLNGKNIWTYQTREQIISDQNARLQKELARVEREARLRDDDLQSELRRLTNLVEFMQNSKFWKFRELLKRIRNTLLRIKGNSNQT